VAKCVPVVPLIITTLITVRQAAAFPVSTYDYATFASAFSAIRKQWPDAPIRAALWNVAYAVWKPFLQTTEADVRGSLEIGALGAFGFSQQVIKFFLQNELDERGKRGTLIFTGGTASVRGTPLTSAFSAGKHAARALSQSLAKEFGKQNVHVAHVRLGLLYQPINSPG
jgi:NAD(P)-dependent dehydrogenase (short-subunit alcohol dehydrogenase family)